MATLTNGQLDAVALQGEWEDFIYPDNKPPEFFTTVAAWIAEESIIFDAPPSFLDVGGGAGRLVYELHHLHPHSYAVMVEPCCIRGGLAGRLLFGPEMATVPIIGPQNETGRITHLTLPGAPHSWPPAVDKTKVTLSQTSLEDFESTHKFDVVSCCNVVDRVKNPLMFVRRLMSFVAPGGLLFISSPLDWNPSLTIPSRWVSDLELLVGEDDLWKVMWSRDLPYVWKINARLTKVYSAQVICVQRACGD